MSWKKFGYACCLSCGFNFIVFQVLFVHLKFGKRTVELSPERIPTASKACFTCGLLNLAIALLTVCYLKGILKYNPVHHIMRVFNMAGRHGPATGANRYRRFTDSMHEDVSVPSTVRDFEPMPPVTPNPPGMDPVRSNLSRQEPPLDTRSPLARTVSSNGTQNAEAGSVASKPPFEMIDLN